MSKRRDRQAEYKHIKKFLELSKDSLKRLKSLNQGLEKSTDEEIKTFYSTHCSTIFYCVYTSFTIIEANMHDRVVKGKGYSEVFTKDLMDLVLPALQRVLEFLPELIHRRWQYNSICTIVRKLFHPQNSIRLRQFGIKILVLWVQALQENAGDECMEMFASAIPHFPPNKTPMGLPSNSVTIPPFSSGGICDRYGVYSTSSLSSSEGTAMAAGCLTPSAGASGKGGDTVNVGVIYPLSPPPTVDKDLVALELMDYLLKCLTTQMYSLHWDEDFKYVRGFGFLFFLFKLFYLAPLYKEFRTHAGLYTHTPPPNISTSTGDSEQCQGLRSVQEESSQDSDPDPTKITPPLSGETRRKHGRSSPYRMSSVIKLEYNTSNPVYSKVQDIILKYVLMWVLPSSSSQRGSTLPLVPMSSSPASSPLPTRNSGFPLEGVELMRKMWFTNRDNVSLLLEICRVGFQTPLSQAPTLRKLVDLYFHWEQTTRKPPFMRPPPVQSYGETTPSTPSLLTASDHTHPDAGRPSILSWEQLSCYEGFKPTAVQAGLQSSLRMIVTHTSQVFLKKAGSREELDNQIEICRKILRLYQDIAVSGDMNHKTWEYCLAMLLHLTSSLLSKSPPADRDSTLGATLVEHLLRTLLVCYLRASMSIKVSPALWDDLLTVVSSLTQWREVIKEWQFVMGSMTIVLAQTVYSLNLADLPLNKLERGDHSRASKRSSSGKELATCSIRLDSFSSINAVLSLRVQRRDTADGRVRHAPSKVTRPHIKVLGKASTEQIPDSDLAEGYPGSKKRISLPAVLSDPTTTKVSSAAQRMSALPEASEELPSPDLLPQRSVTTTTLVSSSRKDESRLAPGGVPSPGAVSLPAEFILEHEKAIEEDSTSETVSELSSKDDKEKGSMYINPSTSTPSPEAFTSKSQKFLLKELAAKQKKGVTASKSVGSVPEQGAKFKPQPPDLVLANANISDSDQESPKKRTRHNSDNPNAESPFAQSVAIEGTDYSERMENRRLATMRKSSSEGNIHRITLPLDTDVKSAEAEELVTESLHSMRRVASITVGNEENTNRDLSVGGGLPHASSSPSMSPPATAREFDRSKLSGSPPHSPLKGQGAWTAESAAIVWQRMLKILGDVNEIHNPEIHAEAMACLEETWKALVNMTANLGIPIGSSPTPPLPDFVPPLDILLPWVIRACSLPRPFHGGRVTAYKLLCNMIIRHWHTLPSQAELAHFYRLMHAALQPNSDMLHIAVKHSSRLFSHCLPGSSILLRDSINAIDCVLSSSSKSSLPRSEALHLLGSLVCLPDHYPHSVPVLSGPCEGVECVSEDVKAVELKEQIIKLLYRSAKTEPVRNSRCLAVFQVGLLLFSELQAGRASPWILEGMDILFASIQLSERSVSVAAVDMLSMLVELAPQIISLYPTLPARILQAICYAIAVFLNDELEGWLEKVVVTLILCLRDWLVALPVSQMVQEGGLDNNTLKTVFEVIQVAAGSDDVSSKQLFTVKNPINVKLAPVDHNLGRSPRGEHIARGRAGSKAVKTGEEVQLSSETLMSSGSSGDMNKIQVAARSVITHLVNLLGHFPFACGTAQMCSVVCEYHDCPSLQHMDMLSTEIFDSPRVQFFSFNDTAIVTFVEIPTQIHTFLFVGIPHPNSAELSGVPPLVKTATYQTRVIVRDVTGKYSWDCAVLYGPEKTSTGNDQRPSLTMSESTDSLLEYLQLIQQPQHVPDPPTLPSDPLQPPSWRTHLNSGRDILCDLLSHIKSTSPECLLFPGTVGLCEAVPVGGGLGVRSEGVRCTEETMVHLLEQQHYKEQSYVRETRNMPSMQSQRASSPQFFPSSLAFHHCRLFLSHLGMLSWEKRNHLDLLEKSNQLILELKHLDNIQAQTSRQTYKVAVLYIAPGQEDKSSIFSNNRGSREYEEFLAGLGWEVEMKTHTGYMGGLKKEFCADCTLPYYATSSEEVLFHVATRLPLKMDQKVRHLGNDFVHIVWSEHWRDYRRTTFKTQFGDVLIIIYPQTNGLYRVQINIERKSNVSQFGPLFDGALVTRESLPALVRTTAINGLRALRSSLIGSRGRYEERLQTIHNITNKKLMSSFEEFSENVMHPLEMTSTQSTLASSRRATPQKSVASPLSIPSLTHTSAHPSYPHKGTSSSPHSLTSHISRSHSPKAASLMSSFLKIPTLKDRAMERFSPPSRRPRASTNDDRMQTSPRYLGIRRNSSVPENLSEIGKALSASDSKAISERKHPKWSVPGSLTSTSMH